MTTVSTPVDSGPRIATLDRVRGLAIVLMVLDHVALLLPYGDVYRLSAGRVAMPLFMLLAGSLFRHLSARYLVVGLGVGTAMTLVVPWAGNPNILVVWCAAAICVAFSWPLPPWVLAAAALTVAANGWVTVSGGSFDVVAVIGLFALGRAVGLGWADTLGQHLPDALSRLGRAPVRWYVGHLLLLQAVNLWLSRG